MRPDNDLVRHAVKREPFWRVLSLQTGKRTEKMRKLSRWSQNSLKNNVSFQQYSWVSL
jgi:hypothetical protein